MKKFYLLSLLGISLSLTNNAQTTIIDDGFEDYATGPYFGGNWSNWNLSASATDLSIEVTTDKAASGSKSGYIGPQNASGGQDALLRMPQTYSSGKVTAEWKMYIPTGSFSYYNLQETTEPGTSWGYDAYANYFDSLSTGESLAQSFVWTYTVNNSSYLYAYAHIPLDEWFTVKQVMDFDNNTLDLYINDTLATYGSEGNAWPGSLHSFGAFDFYSAAGTDEISNSYYIDDVLISYQSANTGVDDVSKAGDGIRTYPNPAREVLYITAEKNIANIDVFNIAGQKVLSAVPNAKSAQLNIHALAAGIYNAQITIDGKKADKKFVIK